MGEYILLLACLGGGVLYSIHTTKKIGAIIGIALFLAGLFGLHLLGYPVADDLMYVMGFAP